MLILSSHLPKAGGTSLLRQYSEIFGDRLLCHYGTDPKNDAPLPLNKTTSIIHGHFNPLVYDHAGSAFRCTFLRDPVDNLISIYLYWKTLAVDGGAEHRRFLAEKPSLLEFAHYPKLRNLASGVMFGGFNMDRFDFIGFHEHRREDIPRLGRMIGVNLDQNRWENRTTWTNGEKEKLKADRKLLQKVRIAISEDVDLYENQYLRRRYFMDHSHVPARATETAG